MRVFRRGRRQESPNFHASTRCTRKPSRSSGRVEEANMKSRPRSKRRRERIIMRRIKIIIRRRRDRTGPGRAPRTGVPRTQKTERWLAPSSRGRQDGGHRSEDQRKACTGHGRGRSSMVRPDGPEPNKTNRAEQHKPMQRREADPPQGREGDVHDLMSLTAG